MIDQRIIMLLLQVSLFPGASCHAISATQDRSVKQLQLSPDHLPGTCLYDGVLYPVGESFRPDPCTHCHCPGHGGGGRARCTIRDCRAQPNCLRWKQKPDDDHIDGEECCKTCLEIGCLHSDGKVYSPGSIIPVQSPCDTCHCPEGGGTTVCTPLHACPRAQCVDATQEEGQCCAKCPNGDNCWYKDRILQSGIVVEEKLTSKAEKEEGAEKTEDCRRCSCPNSAPPRWLPSSKITAVCLLLKDCQP